MKRGFEAESIDEEVLFKADETHFVADLNYGRKLSMKGDESVEFADVVCGDVGMTMIFILEGGSRSNLGVPFINFQNDRSSYTIQGVPQNTHGVCYRSGPNICMDSHMACVLTEWLSKKRVMSRIPCDRQRIM